MWCFGKFSFVFPSAFPVTISCFCAKLFGICTKQNIFCTKTGGNSTMFFQNFRDLLSGLRSFFCFFFWFFPWKNPFLKARSSVNERIYSDQLHFFMLFSDDSINFSASFPVLFCIFPSACEKNLLLFHPDHPFFEIFSLRRNNFSCLFPSGTEKFFISFPYFLRFSWIFSKEKSAFSLSVTQFQTCFSSSSG